MCPSWGEGRQGDPAEDQVGQHLDGESRCCGPWLWRRRPGTSVTQHRVEKTGATVPKPFQISETGPTGGS